MMFAINVNRNDGKRAVRNTFIVITKAYCLTKACAECENQTLHMQLDPKHQSNRMLHPSAQTTQNLAFGM